MREKILIFILILLLGVLLGILFQKYSVPKIELLLIPEREIELPALIVPPEREKPIFCQKIRRGIEVDLSQQKLRLCENGKARYQFSVSTGKKETPTPTGEFTIIYKSPMIYSKIVESWLPFWVGFFEDYGFHELPITAEGKRVGEDEIGQPASLGCIRLKIGEAEKLYQFAEIRMRVVIFGETP